MVWLLDVFGNKEVIWFVCSLYLGKEVFAFPLLIGVYKNFE